MTTLALVLVLLAVLAVTAYFKLRQSGLLSDDSEQRLAASLASLVPGPKSRPPPALGAFREPPATAVRGPESGDGDAGALQLCAAVPAGSAIDPDQLAARLEVRLGTRPACTADEGSVTVQIDRLRARVQIAPGSSMVGRLARAGAIEAEERRAVVQSAAVLLVDRVSGDPNPIGRARFATEVLLATLDVCSAAPGSSNDA